MMTRIVTGIALISVIAAFVACGYFVSPIFLDMLILIFLAGALFEMRKCLKEAGYDMYIAPAVIMLVLAYPVFYLMQYYLGENAGIQGLLAVLLVSLITALSIFTFKPHAKKKVKDGVVNAHHSNAINIEICVGDEDTEEDEAAKAKSQALEAVQKSGINNLFANVFILIYPTVFMSVAWIISYKYSAFFAVLFAICVPAIGSDMFAYFIGSLIRGKKLCPSISPKKTISGAIGGLIGGMAIAIVFWVLFEYVGGLYPEFLESCGYVTFFDQSDEAWIWQSALVYLAIGLVCGVVSEIGDLAASSIKRALGIKDYGKIFPGHGGFMDRIDSVMYCLVVLLIAFTCIYGR